MHEALGYVGVLVAVLCFGSYAVPVKIFPTGDGFVFQWIECCAILVIGFIAEVIAGHPFVFEPLAMAGGAFWCIGNITVIPIVDSIGLGIGMLIWGVVNMLVGWSAGHFGLIVPKEEGLKYPYLNYLGVAVAALSIILYLPIKPNAQKKSDDEDSEKSPLLSDKGSVNTEAPPPLSNDMSINDHSSNNIQSSGSGMKKVFGIVGAFIAGLLYGVNMLPVSYLQGKNPNANPLAFAMSHYAGIFLTSTLIVIVYAIFKKNKPQFYPQTLLPALFAGTLWGIAQSGWFVGNANLGLTTTFPMICTGPGIIANLWGVFVFKEISGKRNFLFLITAFLLTVTGILLITFSH